VFATIEDFKALEPAFEDVPVPEIGEGKVIRVRVMAALAKDRWELANFKVENGVPVPAFDGSRARLVAACCCHADFTPMFTPADVEWLNEKRSDVVDRLYEAAERLNGIRSGIELAKKVYAALRSDSQPSTSLSGLATPPSKA
jgi:hypothetical protein